MIFCNDWHDFKMLDCGDFKKLEKWGEYILIRPESQAVWPIANQNLWTNKDAEYITTYDGHSKWNIYNDKLPKTWNIKYKKNIKFQIQLMPSSKHTGIFPEQISNWDIIDKIIKKNSDRNINILNLFAYTGASTTIALAASEKVNVCHVDASKKMIDIARKNILLSNLNTKNVRWILDDCNKFVKREIKREKKYDIIILDPPSYGKGPSNEIWKIEKKIFDLINDISKLFSEKPLMLLINTYSTHLSLYSISYILKLIFKNNGKIINQTLSSYVYSSDLYIPSGNTTQLLF